MINQRVVNNGGHGGDGGDGGDHEPLHFASTLTLSHHQSLDAFDRTTAVANLLAHDHDHHRDRHRRLRCDGHGHGGLRIPLLQTDR